MIKYLILCTSFTFLCTFSIPFFGYSQTMEITGHVVDDETGVPLLGASVTIENSANGTITNQDGFYLIRANPLNKERLVFSFLGYETKTFLIEDQKEINVRLTPKNSTLEGVVVVGFGTQQREKITSAISKLDNKVLENTPYSNVTSSLEGSIPGLRVQSNSGQPGSRPRVILRGGTSINNPNGSTPLYVIDGVISDNMDNINPFDIKSVQVLKDAASASIYGARSSNGVIIVETKDEGFGKELKVKYDYALTVSKVGRTYDILMGEDYVRFARIGIANTASITPSFLSLLDGVTYAGGIGNDLTRNTYLSLQPLTSENEYKLGEGWEKMQDPLDPDRTLIFSNTDYQKRLFQTAVSHHHHLAISGGGEKSYYRLGVGYQNNEGIAIKSSYKRLDLNFDGGLKIGEESKIYTKVRFNNISNHILSSIHDRFQGTMIQPPTQKLFLEDGTLSPGRNTAFVNAEYILSTTEPLNTTNNHEFVIGGHFKIAPNIFFDPQISYMSAYDYNRNFTQSRWEGVAVFNSSRPATSSFNKVESPQGSAVFTYENNFKGMHNLEAKLGYQYFETNMTSVGASGSHAATDNIPTLNGSATPESVSGEESQQKIFGFFTRVNYDFGSKYLISASLRYDGASNLGEEEKWAPFPAISLGWNMDKEDFWQDIFDNFFSLKLRGSYGVTGNISGLGFYQALGSYNTSQRYDGEPAVMIQELPNPALRWERSKTLDIGFDGSLFRNNINFNLDFFNRTTSNLLTNLALPPSSGFLGVVTNLGTLRNRGFEFVVDLNLLPHSSNFKWNLSFNLATVHSKIMKLPDNGQKNNRIGGVFVFDPEEGEYMYKGGLQEGGRIGDLYGYQQVGVYPTDEDALEGPIDMLIPEDRWPKLGGDVNWLDVDRNDTIDTRDQVYMGNPFPTLTGGFSTSVSFKNLELNVRMDYSKGATIYFETGARLEGNFSGSGALSKKLLNSWQEQGDITDIPRYYWADQNAHWNIWNDRGSSRYFQKADFLSIREVSLSYSINDSFLRRIGISKMRLYFAGNNLHYFTKYEGLNPEETASDVAYPIPKNFTFGASLTF